MPGQHRLLGVWPLLTTALVNIPSWRTCAAFSVQSSILSAEAVCKSARRSACGMSIEGEIASSLETDPRQIIDQSTLTLLEHVNLNVPSHEFILPFYFSTLGCGMDPRKAQNLEPDAPKKTLWANCGASQFHLPYGETAQTIPGHIGLRYDSLQGLKERIAQADLEASFQTVEVGTDPGSGREFVKLVDNYNNIFFCRSGNPVNSDKIQPIIDASQTEKWGTVATKYGLEESDCRGIDYVEFKIPQGTAEKISLFYESVFDATTTCISAGDGDSLKVTIVAFGKVDATGRADQSLVFRETTEPIPPYDGHHIALYVGQSAKDFEQAFRNTKLAGIVWCNPRFSDQVQSLEQAQDEKQFRFKDIIDMETGQKIFELEHEVRSIEHGSWPGKSHMVQE